MLYSVRQIRQIEQAASAKLEGASLMQRAGHAAAQTALSLLAAPSQPVLILAGPGNNGGDAFECAAHLAHAGHQVSILHHPPKTARTTDSAASCAKAQSCREIVWLSSDALPAQHVALVVDGLFGIGLSAQKMSGVMQKQIRLINAMDCPVLALDVPSGLDADTGIVRTPVAIQATHTITFIGDKAGLHTCDGRDYAGMVEVADLAIDPALFPLSDAELNHTELFSSLFQPRTHNSNKSSNGSVHLIGGAAGMQGALVLAARAALYSGAGRTFAGFIDTVPGMDILQPEIMCRSAQQLPVDPDAVLVVGPGLGNSVASFDLVSRALLGSNLLVLDADALNLMAQQPALIALCNGRDADSTLLTPHPLEAARLLACSVEQIQADRVAAAKKLARRFSSVVILKGSGSIIARPDGHVVINPTGNPGLATGGSGDVLAGACGAMLAQHHTLWPAALGATYLHGAAADSLVLQGIGPVGLTPSELIVAMRTHINEHCQQSRY